MNWFSGQLILHCDLLTLMSVIQRSTNVLIYIYFEYMCVLCILTGNYPLHELYYEVLHYLVLKMAPACSQNVIVGVTLSLFTTFILHTSLCTSALNAFCFNKWAVLPQAPEIFF